MHPYLKQLWQKPLLALKSAGALILALIVLLVVVTLVKNTLQTVGVSTNFGVSPPAMMGGNRMMYDDGMDYEEDMAMAEGSMAKGYANTSMPVPTPMPPREPGNVPGEDAEEFEVTEYNATINTRNADVDCADVAALKTRDDVIFENSNEYDTGCNYTFKVRNSAAPAVLDVITGLDPDRLTENTYTIKRTVDSITSEKEILEEKLESINDTLEEALNAYDEISAIATSTRDAESLASIIDSKVRLIERLTQERINISTQLSRIEKNMSNQLDRLDYTYFYVTIREDKYVDFDNLGESWKNAVRTFVHDINTLAQDISIGVVMFVLYLAQYLLYAFILLIVAKYSWKHAKTLWRK